MSLERIDAEILREAHGFSFSMRVTGTQQTIRIFVADDALDLEDDLMLDEDRLLTQFKADRQAFEAIANERHVHGRLAANGAVAITLADLVEFIE